MTIAQNIAQKCAGASAYSLYAGHAIHHDIFTLASKTTRFPPGKVLREKRDGRGRMVSARYQYEDGSIITLKRIGERVILALGK